jgi:hypothetical protein
MRGKSVQEGVSKGMREKSLKIFFRVEIPLARRDVGVLSDRFDALTHQNFALPFF